MTTTQNTRLVCFPPICLDTVSEQELQAYFTNTWEMYEVLFSAILPPEVYYEQPDPLRNPLIFYYGHTAAFYINKLRLANLLKEGINPRFEELFAKGVDPDSPQNLPTRELWASFEEVKAYRRQVFECVSKVIAETPFALPITENAPFWALLMSIEHDRIHFETSSLLIRQLPKLFLQRPDSWQYARSLGNPPKNKLISVQGGTVTIGKPKDSNIYGWDNEYGTLEVKVNPFEATQNLISNAEFLIFVQDGGYENSSFWTEEGWHWKTDTDTHYPKFWVKEGQDFRYRAMFDEWEMPLDFPVEVNALEAQAYCAWKGAAWRLLSEAEFHLIGASQLATKEDVVFSDKYNLSVLYGSPTPVGFMQSGQDESLFHDLFGNVWDWLQNDFYPLPQFEIHDWYDDFSLPYFDNEHSMMIGGSWASSGTSASKYYRLWFRRNFFQHAGFRLAKNL